MKLYVAPLEGVTGYVFRNTHHAFFAELNQTNVGADAYFTPFVVANHTNKLKVREMQDVLPQNNIDPNGASLPIVPQVLTNKAEELLFTAQKVAALGYDEININLGCPVGTVAAKHKGSGMLAYPDELDAFLDGIFAGKAAMDAALGRSVRISVKTRLGYLDPAEVHHILEIYNRYPISELSVHARTRKEFYSGQPHLELFQAMLEETKIPLIYNGNVYSLDDYRLIRDRFPASQYPLFAGMMIGRGIIADPALIRKIRVGEDTHWDPAATAAAAVNKKELREYHQALYNAYVQLYVGNGPGDNVLVGRMKEVWTFLGSIFQEPDKYLKNIHKAKSRVEYDAAVRMLLSNCELKEPDNGLLG